MLFSDNDHQFIDAEFFRFQIIGRGVRKSDAKLKTTICDGLLDLSRVINLKIQRHLGILHAELSQSLRQDVFGGDHNACDVEASDHHLPQLGSLTFSCCYLLQQVIGVTMEKDARFSQVHPPSNTAK